MSYKSDVERLEIHVELWGNTSYIVYSEESDGSVTLMWLLGSEVLRMNGTWMEVSVGGPRYC